MCTPQAPGAGDLPCRDGLPADRSVSGGAVNDRPAVEGLVESDDHGLGFLHVAAVMDLWSRRIVGWAMASHLRAELVIEAVEMATSRRRPSPGLIHHSDQGPQYTSFSFGRRLRESGILPSMGRTGTPADNAVVESFFDTMKLELLVGRRYRTREEAKAAIFEWMEVFYNRHRSTRHRTARTPGVGTRPSFLPWDQRLL